MTGTQNFGERLAAAVARRESQIVLGLDPDPSRLWPAGRAAGDAHDGSPAQRAGAAILAHCIAAIDAAGPACVAIKPQVACFERVGAPGWKALRKVSAHAREAGLMVLADGKRGDIDVSARAYAQALLGSLDTPFGVVDGVPADALTVNPYLGPDSLAPFVELARPAGKGLFALVRTSNPGAAHLQDEPLAGGDLLWERVARMTADLGEAGRSDPAQPIADVGAVVGATAPEHLARARELMPAAPFLLPGVGAQGGHVEDLAPAFAPGRAGGLVAASRGIVDAHGQTGGDPAESARAAAERLRAIAWGLA